MQHFIKDVRTAFKAPKLPFVIAGMGHFAHSQPEPKPDSATSKILAAQLAMKDVAEFKGNVAAFKTAPFCDKLAAKMFPTWRDNFEKWQKVGSDRPYHYLGSGIWYSRIGKKAGEEMIKLLK